MKKQEYFASIKQPNQAVLIIGPNAKEHIENLRKTYCYFCNYQNKIYKEKLCKSCYVFKHRIKQMNKKEYNKLFKDS